MAQQENNPHDIQVGGSHYKKKIEPIEFIEKNNLSFSEGNIVKYITRYREKNGVQDLQKVLHYLDFVEYYFTKKRKKPLVIEPVTYIYENRMSSDDGIIIANLIFFLFTGNKDFLNYARKAVNNLIKEYD